MRILVLPLLAVTACGPTARDCLSSTRASAERLGEGDWVPEGPHALARPGDALLANPEAAFVIQGPDDPRTYYHYGGTPIDAVPMDGCTQTSPDLFTELGFTPGAIDLLDLTSSILRQFRADTLEVVDDGAEGGAAHVRVTGGDDRFWLVDQTLTTQAASSGRRRPLSEPFPVRWTVDYRLPARGQVLDMRVSATNLSEDGIDLLNGVILFPGGETEQIAWGAGELSIGGFRLLSGIPWLSLDSPDTSYALAVDGGVGAFTNISGANVLVDTTQVLEGSFSPSAAGTAGDTVQMQLFLSVASGRAHDAATPLVNALSDASRRELALREVSGTVDATGPAPVVQVEAQRTDGGWATLDRVDVDEDGGFAARLPDAWPLRLVAEAGEADPSVPFVLPGGDVADVQLATGPSGTLTVRARDGEAATAARVTLDRESGQSRVLFVPPEGLEVVVPAGPWTAHVTRGFEHAPHRATVTVPPGGAVELTAPIPRVVDTTGWISADGHVHASPSPDSAVLPELRFATVATEGVDVMVQTDHEVIVDLSDTLAASPWDEAMRIVLGEEVTATVPEHLNMWGVPLSPDDGPRGAPVVWYGQGLGELYAAMRDRGAAVVQLNHPNWMNDIRYDVLTGAPEATDPTLWGLPADASLWSWDLDAIELQNGFKFIWGDASRPGTDGLFRAWSSFFNLGHRVTGVGVSDVHGRDRPGDARTYVAVPDDRLEAFVERPLLSGVVEGRALVSTGAFPRLTVRAGGEEAGLGDTLTAADGRVTLALDVQALPGIRVDRAVVFANCDAVDVLAATAPDALIKLDGETTLRLDADAWITVAVFGSGPYPRGLAQPPDHVARAITNPVFVDVDGNGRFDPPGGRTCDFGDAVPTAR